MWNIGYGFGLLVAASLTYVDMNFGGSQINTFWICFVLGISFVVYGFSREL